MRRLILTKPHAHPCKTLIEPAARAFRLRNPESTEPYFLKPYTLP